MRLQDRLIRSLCALAYCFLVVGAAQAGTIINTNLPAGTTIVNIDARADGSASFSGDSFQSFWYRPTPTAPSLTFLPGTYAFRIVNPTDAAALYPSLTGAQLSQIYTAWTYNSPWSDNYLAFKSTAVANSSESQLFDGAIAPGIPASQTFGSATAAYNGTIANGYYNKVRPAPPGRAGIAADYLTQYTFSVPTTVLFVVPDWLLADNAGGVSVVVSTVPEPSTFVLAFAGLAAMSLIIRKKWRHS